MSLESSEYVTIQVRVPRWIKEILDKYSIDIELIVQKILEHEMKTIMLREIEKELDKIRNKLNMTDEEIVRLIREDRDRM
ncbi:MAG: hypothetical protein GXO10_00995 [Crenarchaeota archaeon]|nr:hypothetical protein [Thermoproteota archaeon]